MVQITCCLCPTTYITEYPALQSAQILKARILSISAALSSLLVCCWLAATASQMHCEAAVDDIHVIVWLWFASYPQCSASLVYPSLHLSQLAWLLLTIAAVASQYVCQYAASYHGKVRIADVRRLSSRRIHICSAVLCRASPELTSNRPSFRWNELSMFTAVMRICSTGQGCQGGGRR